MIPVDATIRRESSYPHSGRLIAMPTSRSLAVGQTLDLHDQVSIDFPAMPDSIELSRSTDYTVLTNMILPDGVHQYKGTRPLEIPFSFKLHAFDQDYCPQGSYTLLQLAARLHSFVLPIDSSGGKVAITAKAGPVASNTEADQEARAVAPDGGIGYEASGKEKVFNPVTVLLQLIFTDQNSPGISALGYLREISTKLNGPWLRGPGQSSNLPSSGEFSFVFVHRPGHGNAFNIDSKDFDLQPQAYASTVKDRLYNTRSLVQVANYQGLNDPPAAQGSRVPSPINGFRGAGASGRF